LKFLKLFHGCAPDPQQLVLPLQSADLNKTLRPQHSDHSSSRTPLLPGYRRIKLGDLQLDYRFLRSKRRSIGFMIDEHGLRITAPKWVSIAEIERATREKSAWIFAKIRQQQERAVRRSESKMKWEDGCKLPYLGGEITVRVSEALTARKASAAHYDLESATLTIDTKIDLTPEACETQLKHQVQRWLQDQALTLFAARLPIYAQALGVDYQGFKLSSAKTRWGSCTTDGRIRLNWRLIHFALPLIDYVVAHELAHRKEMNHGPRFWAAVGSVFPEFETTRKQLRSHPPERLPVF
jgi:predicted metal-dependent hydrolase